MNRLVVVGGGILGTMHAVEAIARGWDVVHLEREDGPRGASVRNFGLVWVSGRAPGRELELALRARRRWEEVARKFPGTGFRATGSLTVVRSTQELTVLEQVVARADADARGLRLVDPSEAQRVNPALAGGKPFLAALLCTTDAVVEPRHVLGALRSGCEATGRYHWLPGREVVGVGEHRVTDAVGDRHGGDLVMLCPGAAHGGLAAEVLADAPIRRVRAADARDRFIARYRHHLAGRWGLTPLLPLGLTPQPGPDLATARPGGCLVGRAAALGAAEPTGPLTIGDTHTSDEARSPSDVDESPYRHLLAAASSPGCSGPAPSLP